jgi:hypothetical protein
VDAKDRYAAGIACYDEAQRIERTLTDKDGVISGKQTRSIEIPLVAGEMIVAQFLRRCVPRQIDGSTIEV